ncbi:MAG TPA: heavy metal-binding protein [Chromatiaceae bacterium]|nr:heavy metal-binding protein [Chromatiaceae bacterium]
MSSEIRLNINGMTCGHCVAHTKKNLEAVPGVSEVEVTLEPGGAVVRGDADSAALIAAVAEAGYEAVIDE